MKNFKIGLSALYFPMTIARYIWEAFEERSDCEVYSVGPFFEDFIPWNYGMRLPQKYVKIPTICLPQQMAQMRPAYELVANQLPNDLDLFVMVDAGWHFSNRPKAKVVALIETDPHVLKGSYDLPKSYSDFTFCMQSNYMNDGEIFLPYGYSKKYHYSELDTEKIYDVCLIGLHYPNRNSVMQELQKRGHKIHYSIGECFDDYRHIYNQSRVAFSWSTLEDTPSRVWESFAMGIPQVCNRTPDLLKFFSESRDYSGFSNVQEAVYGIEYLLERPEQAQAMARSAYEQVRPHSWDDRVEQILKTCELI